MWKRLQFFKKSAILFEKERLKGMKIWAKLMSDGKIKKQIVYEKEEKLAYSRFYDYLVELCAQLDIPTPVLLKTHIFDYAKFNHTRFIPRDFVESFSYDSLVLEHISD